GRKKVSTMESNVSNSDTNVKASFPYVIDAYGSTSPTSIVAKIHEARLIR
ncbi:hypothetical protein Tco_0634241, partial [Tanacetum coccineum]